MTIKNRKLDSATWNQSSEMNHRIPITFPLRRSVFVDVIVVTPLPCQHYVLKELGKLSIIDSPFRDVSCSSSPTDVTIICQPEASSSKVHGCRFESR